MAKQEDNFLKFENDFKSGLLSENAFENLTKKSKTEINKDGKISTPKISIIITTYNRKILLRECVLSILMQKYTNFEIIIVDDCSNDGTKEFMKDILQDKRINYYKNIKNLGASESRRKGYSLCKGEYIIFCDDDDYYIDNSFFEECSRIFLNNKINMICANSYIKYEKENIYSLVKLNFLTEITSYEYLYKFQYEYLKPNSTFCCVFRKNILDKAEINDMKMINDSSIYLKALTQDGIVFNYPRIIGIYRIHSSNITFNITSDFIIDNLNEKKNIYDFIKNKYGFLKANKWYEKQMLLTIKYYIFNSCPSEKDVNKVIVWLKINKVKYYDITFKIRMFQLKVMISKILKS